MKTMRQGFFCCVLACGAMQVQAAGQLVDVRIVDRDTGVALRQYPHRGEIWVEGIPGARYAIAFANRAGERLLAVASVDGVNILSGETAAWDQGGYVLSPHQRYQITGWRKSDSAVAAFTFADAASSYAGLTGRPDNIGVVGIALYREQRLREPAVVPEPWPRQRSDQLSSHAGPARDAPAPAGTAPARERADQAPRASAEASASAASQGAASGKALADAPGRLGTGHGERESSWVTRTRFERAQARPDEVIRIRYDSRANLLAQGVIPAPARAPRPPLADPFPLSGQASYVPDPPSPR